MINGTRVTGVIMNYYHICHRKVWLFDKNIRMERESDLVAIGKIIDEESYKREKKHITIDNIISIDFIRSSNTLHEVKKSNSNEKADIYQLKYYIYYLNNRGIDNLKGVIDYPKMKKRVKIELTEDDKVYLDNACNEIDNILKSSKPPEVLMAGNNKICKRCSYYDLCYI